MCVNNMHDIHRDETTNCHFPFRLSADFSHIQQHLLQLQQFKSGAIQLSNQDGTKENGDGEKVMQSDCLFICIWFV